MWKQNILPALSALILIFTTEGKTQSFNNPSFEGMAPQQNMAAPSWVKCQGTPDIQPGSWNYNLPPDQGSAWAGLLAGNQFGTYGEESIGQLISGNFSAGVTYSFTLRYSNPTSVSFSSKAGYLDLYGGNSSCSQTYLLYTSSLIPANLNSWTSMLVSFTAPANFSYLRIQSRSSTTTCCFNMFNLGVDNISPITSQALPVELTLFTAICYGDKNLVKWETASEKNNRYFEVQRSNANTDHWMVVCRVEGTGNSTSLHHYEITDAQPPANGLAYYRLKQVDYNGEYEYSPVVAVNIDNCRKKNITISPAGNGMFVVSGSEQFDELAVFDISGVKISSAYNQPLPFILNLAGHGKGFYIVRIQFGNTVLNSKIIIHG